MGMFNWVDYECTCLICHGKVDGFQTKDGEWENLQLKHLAPADVDHFHSSCEKCGCWIEFSRKDGNSFEKVAMSSPDHPTLKSKTVRIGL